METTKEQLNTYYADQLARIKNPKSEYAPTIVINHESGKTNHLSLNDESASVIVDWLTQHYNVTPVNKESKTIQFVKVNRDVNGNPRYACHFLNFITDKDEKAISAMFPAGKRIDERYKLALKRAKQLGGRKFHNKQYGGGIVFQSYNIQETEKQIIELVNNL